MTIKNNIEKLKRKNLFFKIVFWQPKSKAVRLMLISLNFLAIMFLFLSIISLYNFSKEQDAQLANFLFITLMENKAQTYEDSVYIKTIANFCEEQEDPLECVWLNVPYDWTDTGVLFISPEKYFETNGQGVCRDNALIIKAILNIMKVKSNFILLPDHIYVSAVYNKKTYIFNTDLTIKYDNIIERCYSYDNHVSYNCEKFGLESF